MVNKFAHRLLDYACTNAWVAIDLRIQDHWKIALRKQSQIFDKITNRFSYTVLE